MDLELTDEQQELQASVRSFLERECPLSLVREVVERGSSDPVDALWSKMVELGWPALTIAEEHGGLGLGYVELGVVCEELGRAIAPGPFMATVTQFAPAVRAAGDSDQQRRFLAPLAAGELTGALAVADGGGRWDPAHLPVSAKRTDGRWQLEGTVRYVPDGARADEIAVAARVDDGVGLFVVPRADVGAEPTLAFDRSRSYATVRLDGVTVDAERALSPGAAAGALERARQEATAALAFETLGACEAIFDMALQYGKEREQFGVPIGSFQAIKHKLADMLVVLERARATCWFAALTIAEDDDRRELAVSMAKAAAGDCQRHVAQEGIQVHGGIGFTWEHDLHLLVKRAKAGDMLLGTAADHRLRVADLIGV